MILEDVLSPEPPLRWLRAPVKTINADGTLTLTVNNGDVPGVRYLDTWNPAPGDMAECIADDYHGILALGRAHAVTAAAPPPGAAPTTTAPLRMASHDDTGWHAQTDLIQAFGAHGVAFYPPLPAGSGRLEIQLTAAKDTYPVLHLVAGDGTGGYQQVSTDWPGPLLKAGAPTWVALPLMWAAMLTDPAQATGIGTSMGIPTVATRLSGADLRITPLA